MSAVRYFDVPHIFRFGRISEEDGETWHSFYRSATSFTIDIKRVDIAGTPFERRWSEYCVEGRRTDWVQRHHEFCDLIIEHILPTLQRLAPIGGRQWSTLEDYLQTPQYKLQLFKDDSADDAIAKVTSGPNVVQAFEMRPQPFSAMDLPDDFPRIAASDIVVLDQEKDLRQRPQKARVSNTGEVYPLICATQPSKAVETGVVSNFSLEAMKRLFRETDDDSSKPFTVVTTTATHPADRDGRLGEPDLKIAGLLHTLVSEQSVVKT